MQIERSARHLGSILTGKALEGRKQEQAHHRLGFLRTPVLPAENGLWEQEWSREPGSPVHLAQVGGRGNCIRRGAKSHSFHSRVAGQSVPLISITQPQRCHSPAFLIPQEIKRLAQATDKPCTTLAHTFVSKSGAMFSLSFIS